LVAAAWTWLFELGVVKNTSELQPQWNTLHPQRRGFNLIAPAHFDG
jgi:hypothetical protein